MLSIAHFRFHSKKEKKKKNNTNIYVLRIAKTLQRIQTLGKKMYLKF